MYDKSCALPSGAHDVLSPALLFEEHPRLNSPPIIALGDMYLQPQDKWRCQIISIPQYLEPCQDHLGSLPPQQPLLCGCCMVGLQTESLSRVQDRWTKPSKLREVMADKACRVSSGEMTDGFLRVSCAGKTPEKRVKGRRNQMVKMQYEFGILRSLKSSNPPLRPFLLVP